MREAGEVFGYPLMLKAKRMAYDGKGNAPVMDKVCSWHNRISPKGLPKCLFDTIEGCTNA